MTAKPDILRGPYVRSSGVIVFYTGRHHAGEVIDQLLNLRRPSPSSQKLAKVTDGASKNFDHQHADELAESTCNAHAFLEFRAIKDKYPDEYAPRRRGIQRRLRQR